MRHRTHQISLCTQRRYRSARRQSLSLQVGSPSCSRSCLASTSRLSTSFCSRRHLARGWRVALVRRRQNAPKLEINEQQGGRARNMLSQHGRLRDLHAIHLSNCIRANSDCCGIGTANFPENPSFPTEASVAVSRRVVRVLRAEDCCSTEQRQQHNSKKKTSSHRSLQMGDHTFHMFHTLLYVGWTSLPLTSLAHCARVGRACASNKMQHMEPFDPKPLRASLFFMTGTKTRTVGTPTR